MVTHNHVPSPYNLIDYLFIVYRIIRIKSISHQKEENLIILHITSKGEGDAVVRRSNNRLEAVYRMLERDRSMLYLAFGGEEIDRDKLLCYCWYGKWGSSLVGMWLEIEEIIDLGSKIKKIIWRCDSRRLHQRLRSL